jgi:hypothetical protein
MQTNNVVQLHRPKIAEKTVSQQAIKAGTTRTEKLYPGKIVLITIDVYMTIAYDQVDGEYKPRFKFWCHDSRIADLYLDENHQLDLRSSCRCIITLISHHIHSKTGRPSSTIIEIAKVPYSWEK